MLPPNLNAGPPLQILSASAHQFLPDANSLTDCLLLADAGYIDRAYFANVNKAGGFYLVPGSKNLNPEILSA